MVHQRSLTRLLSLVSAFLLVIFVVTLPVSAYGNIYAHPGINEQALIYFKNTLMPEDAYLAPASLDGAASAGIDWPQDQGVSWLPGEGTVSVPREKTLSSWIIDGGFTADEPELYQGMRHFYDPKNSAAPYLTDHQFFSESVGLFMAHFNLGVYGETDFPKITAVEWAFDKSNANLYSYPYAKMYFKKALLSDDRNNEYYGKAWRGVGETMHLVSDMTVPAHVRNDGHGIEYEYYEWDIDPYEATTHGGTIRANAGYPPARLNYNQDLQSMMKSIALFTNEHFISQDTNDDYSLPDLTRPPSEDGYIHGIVDGNDYRVARSLSSWQKFLDIRAMPNMLASNPSLDEKVLADQKRILIPTAIRGSAAVLDRFLPRFKVYGDIKTSQVVQDKRPVTQYFLDGEILFFGNKDEWPEKLTIRNGAGIVNSATGERIIIPVDGTTGDNLNQFRYLFIPAEVGARAGDKIYLEYDLGGYVVRSADIEVPEEYPTPTPTTPVTTRVTAAQPTAASGTCPASWQAIAQDYGKDYSCRRTLQYYTGFIASGSLQSSIDSQRQTFLSCGCCDLTFDEFVLPGGGTSYRDAYYAICSKETPTITPRITTRIPATTIPTPKPTQCMNQGVNNRDCTCLCSCYKDNPTAQDQCISDCSKGYSFYACSS
ncbi:MAG: hypothetical protein CVV32_05915 [Methanomicrobiales archaeon HGW-Methanomicrobiales-3]|jgi:hypothetical protein|nr:MAG: hypothetical protein CVV32_05915 [Methanomicrobiales archaeon HGW-Methanomicrobiales-3]